MYRLVVFIVLFSAYTNFAQIHITVNDEDQYPIPSVHISLFSESGKLVAMKLTDSNGKLEFSEEETKGIDTFDAKVSFIGFETIYRKVRLNQAYSFILKESNVMLNQVVVTAQYSENSPEKAVHKIEIIDRKKIDAMGAITLQDALSNSMGIRIEQDNILGSGMSLQGVSGQNVKILIDGVPVIGRLNGNIDLSQINLDNIERIEIVKGPLSVNYGTNALAGAINLITKTNKKGQFSVGGTSYYESAGKFNFTGKVGFNKKNNDVLITGGRNYFDGWNDGDQQFKNPTPIADSTRFKSWKPKEQLFGGVQLGKTIKNVKLKYKGDLFKETIWNRGYPRPPYQETAFDDDYQTARIDNALFFNRKGKQSTINALASINHFERTKNTFYTDLTTLDRVLTENAGDQDTSVFNQFLSRGSFISQKDSAKLNYQIGYEINIEQAEGRRIESGTQEQGDYALFASSEYSHNNFIVRPGLRYAYNTSYSTPLLPSLNVKFGKDKYAIRASFARGFRAPSLKELYFNFVDINHNIVGSNNLKAETSANYILTMAYNILHENLIFKSEIGGFYNAIKDQIALAQTDGTQYTYVNIGEFQSVGGQADFQVGFYHFKANVGGSYIGRSNSVEADGAPQFSFSPELRSSLLYELKKQGLTMALFYKYQGKLPNVIQNADGQIQTNYIEAYHTSDFTLSKKLYKKQIDLSIGVKNIFDVKRVASSTSSGGAHSSGGATIPVGMGRTYFAALKLNLTKWKKANKE
ncbi:MAG: TonB-dependent receptor [Flavobacteriales bacterium]|jgi:outer membrane receptor for ferrienterochelin and colicins|nr:TonB-dependent receptor [Flavobacteriales bacterium]